MMKCIENPGISFLNFKIKRKSMRFGFFDSDGLKLRYFECGEGEPLILIHGLEESIEGGPSSTMSSRSTSGL